MGRGSGDKIAGAWNKLKGRSKKAAGTMTNNPRRWAEGDREFTRGGGKPAVGDLKNAGQKVGRKLRNAFH